MKGWKDYGYGTTSPCMIKEIWSKCGAKWGAIDYAYNKNVVEPMKKIADGLDSPEMKQAYWEQVKADPKVIAEFKAKNVKQ